MPPPRSSGISRALVPIGNSNTPVRFARPDTPYSLVPPSLDLPCDRPLNQSAPCTTIGAMLHSDSTLLTTVGRPQAPEICGNGGLARGFAWRPSSELISAVSSPQLYRPAPACTQPS